MVDRKIPMLDLTAEVEELWPELMDAIQGVLRSGKFIMGPNVKAFEDEVARYLGVKNAIAVNSGTDALVIALKAAGVKPGDEVITTPFTFFATGESINQVGATPVFVDIDPETFNIDANLIPSAITSRTKAIIPVHLYGLACNMASIMDVAQKNGLVVIEDCAQSFGATYRGQKTGTIGHVGCFSFFPSKNLGAYGDGGLIASDAPELAEYAKALRVHGSKRKYHNEFIGYNSRLDELQAAILRTKLPHIDAMNNGRNEVAARYGQLLAGLTNVTLPWSEEGDFHSYHQYTIRIIGNKREHVRQELEKAGISTMVYYPLPLHKLPVYVSDGQTFEHSERAADEVLSLPIWPTLTAQDQEYVAKHLTAAVR